MIKFKGEKDGKVLLGLGISEANVRKLKEGMPILIDDPDFFEGTILLMYGKTEKDMAREMLPFIVPGTIIKKNLGKD